MLTDEELRAVCAKWEGAAPRTKKALLKKLEAMRAKAQAAEPFISQSLETWRKESEEVCYYSAESFGDYGAAPAIELATLQKLFSSQRVAAWEKAARFIKAGLNDPEISSYPELHILFRTAMDAVTETADFEWCGVNELLVTPEAAEAVVSQAARRNAKSKNDEPRAWVFREWAARSNRKKSKRKFAEEYAPLVNEKFKIRISADRIERYWLPKGPPA